MIYKSKEDIYLHGFSRMFEHFKRVDCHFFWHIDKHAQFQKKDDKKNFDQTLELLNEDLTIFIFK